MAHNSGAFSALARALSCLLVLVALTLPLRAQEAPASSVPLPNRANEVLPSWLRVRGEFRERVEGFDNASFDAARDDVYSLSRFRFNAVVSSKHVSGTVQVQDSRVALKTVGPTGAPFTATFDLRQAFVDVGAAGSHVTARLGRQELAFGDQRLVGPANWLNSSRTFDAARVTVKSRPLQVDLFAASVVRILEDEFDKSGNGNRFAGAYVTAGQVIPRGTLEPYVLWRRDVNQLSENRISGTLREFTSGVRIVGRLPASLDYDIEMSLQAGSLGPDSVSAWAGYWQARRTFAGRTTPHVSAGYSFASGDENPADGTRGTFDQLYPSGHDKHGLADQVSWKNIHDVRVGFDVSPFKATPITVNYHSYWLADRHDALYASSGAAIARVPSGAASAHVGQELDVQATRSITPQVLVGAGYARLFTGAFLEEATPGQPYRAYYVTLTYVFLAER